MNQPDNYVLQLFPKICSLYFLKEDLTELNKLKSFEFNEFIPHTYATSSFKVLDFFPSIQSLIIEKFNHFKNTTLLLNSTDFKISSSWGTKIEPNGRSGAHNHRNSFYSGILYWEDFKDVKLVLEDFYKSGFFIIPDKWNDKNYLHFYLETLKNNLFFFPSEIYHSVTTNTTSQTRYSLAFNIMPVGTIGRADSSVTIDIK